MDSELDPAAKECLGHTSQVSNLDLSFNLGLLDVVDGLTSDSEDALLIPSKHVDFLDLIRKQKCLYIICL